MKSKITRITLTLCLAIGSVTSLAYPTVTANSTTPEVTTMESSSSTAKADNLQNGRVYIFGDLGYGTIDMGASANAPTGGLSWNVGGGYLWHKDSVAYGPELSYTSLPSVNFNLVGGGANATIYGNSVNFLAVGEFFLNPVFAAVGKAGPAIVTQTYNSTASTRLLPSMYVGGLYKVDDHIAVNAGYQYISGGTPMYAVLGGVTITV